jgi:hypothetical protein
MPLRSSSNMVNHYATTQIFKLLGTITMSSQLSYLHNCVP